MEFSEIDRTVISRLSGDLPSGMTPFAEVAADVGLDENELLRRIERYGKENVLRRFAAIVAHRSAGFVANALVAWCVPEDRVVEAAETMSAFDEVSHCYERLSYPRWPYNIYTMIHGRDRDQCIDAAKEMSARTGVRDYRLLFTVREFKKKSMRYFHEVTDNTYEDGE